MYLIWLGNEPKPTNSWELYTTNKKFFIFEVISIIHKLTNSTSNAITIEYLKMLDNKGVSISDWFDLENENASEDIEEDSLLRKRKISWVIKFFLR